jgi:hypothetical protein
MTETVAPETTDMYQTEKKMPAEKAVNSGIAVPEDVLIEINRGIKKVI